MKLDLGTSDGGVRHQLKFEHDRVISESIQDDHVIDNIVESVHVDSQKRQTRDGMQHIARIPITMYQEWRNEWMGKGKYQKLGAAPMRQVSWNKYLEIKVANRDYERLHTKKITQGGRW